MPQIGLAVIVCYGLVEHKQLVTLGEYVRVGPLGAQFRVLLVIPDRLPRAKSVLLRDLNNGVSALDLNCLAHASSSLQKFLRIDFGKAHYTIASRDSIEARVTLLVQF